ncbi:MAG: peptidoglycan editing factor PgeF [Acidithiobacillus sp.]|uniref:peptidoglycan editing factor PgeF n=1 Tax=Acidithiobacillus sp. TaxID=1872118 RepID=UPI003D0542F0
MATETDFLFPVWGRPATVRAAISLRTGGFSTAPFASFNLGDHVGDRPERVARNRAQLQEVLALPSAPCWLHQVHGTRIVKVPEAPAQGWSPPEADGAVSTCPGVVLGILSADCLPVLACSRDGQCIGAFHAGWRGLLAGVLEQGIAAMGIAAKEILVYLGPSIGPRRYEVGAELRAAFLAQDPGTAPFFAAVTAESDAQPGKAPNGDRFWADLPGLARYRLLALGVASVEASGLCTAEDATRFFSYRRDGQTGRMASLIWKEVGA